MEEDEEEGIYTAIKMEIKITDTPTDKKKKREKKGKLVVVGLLYAFVKGTGRQAGRLQWWWWRRPFLYISSC